MGKVENNRRTKLLPKIILGQLFFALIVIGLAGSVIFYGQGYRFNWKTLKVIKTGTISLDYLPEDASILINNKEYKEKPPVNFNFTSGNYSIKISKDGYQDWQNSVLVESEEVSTFRGIVLFKSNIVATELIDQRKIDLLKSPSDILASDNVNDLNYTDHEIWVGGNLITRFDNDISKAIWYPDFRHIVYQQAGEIRVIEDSGKNDTLLVKLDQNTPTSFVLGSRGQDLYFLDSGKYKVAVIR